jgi:FkbM family methyltransferase
MIHKSPGLTNIYRNLHKDVPFHEIHDRYLRKIKDVYGYTPKVIYDIGSAVLHWHKGAKEVWPDSQYYFFEAVREVEDFYDEMGVTYQLDVLSDEVGKEVTYYQDLVCLGGNSYYRENPELSPAAVDLYSDSSGMKRITNTVDNIVKIREFELPDFVKIDVQGAELDILRGMTETLVNVQHMIIELQHDDYNIGAPKLDRSVAYLDSIGFELVHSGQQKPGIFYAMHDADYHFKRK